MELERNQNLFEEPKRFTDVIVETDSAIIVFSSKSANPTEIREVNQQLPIVGGKYSENWEDIENATNKALEGKTDDDLKNYLVTRKEKVKNENGNWIEKHVERSILDDIHKCDEDLKIKYSPLLQAMALKKGKNLVGFSIYCVGFQRVLSFVLLWDISDLEIINTQTN